MVCGILHLKTGFPTMRSESGSSKAREIEIGCASSEEVARNLLTYSYDGCFTRIRRGQVGCHLRSSLESLGWDFEGLSLPPAFK